MDKILELVKKCRGSSFNKYGYEVNLCFNTFVDSLVFHTWYRERTDVKTEGRQPSDDKKFNKLWLQKVTPEFQRANTKWNKSMKQKFIENLLSGVKTELLLFRMNEQDDAQIIDGLQRTTAIIDFFHGKVKPFGYDYNDLKSNLKKFPNHNLTIKIYTFETWEEVGKFYVDMNENITHSKSDIQKAKDWFLANHNVVL